MISTNTIINIIIIISLIFILIIIILVIVVIIINIIAIVVRRNFLIVVDKTLIFTQDHLSTSLHPRLKFLLLAMLKPPTLQVR